MGGPPSRTMTRVSEFSGMFLNRTAVARRGHDECFGWEWALPWLPDQHVTRYGGGTVVKEDISRKDAK